MAPSGVVKGWSARGCCGVSRPFLGRRKKTFRQSQVGAAHGNLAIRRYQA
jgi:hypothetical protein